jgi:hypothetical protein
MGGIDQTAGGINDWRGVWDENAISGGKLRETGTGPWLRRR